jgi:hypothetical protein
MTFDIITFIIELLLFETGIILGIFIIGIDLKKLQKNGYLDTKRGRYTFTPKSKEIK